MATLRELCKNADAITRIAEAQERCARAKAELAAYERRRRELSAIISRSKQPSDGRIFRQGQQRRPVKGKVKNRASSEAMGTIPTMTVTKRFPGSRLTCVCKTKNLWY